MGKSWLDTVYWPEPPRVLYFEKRADGAILNCQITVQRDSAMVRGDDDEISVRYEWGAESEAKAVEYVEGLGYVRAADWNLPPPPADV